MQATDSLLTLVIDIDYNLSNATTNFQTMNGLSSWSYRYRVQSTYSNARAIWRARTRSIELEKLVQWAKRKRLYGPRQFYERRLREEEQKLLRLRVRHPCMMFLIAFLHTFFTQIRGEPRYYAKGSAKKYRTRSQRRGEEG